MLRIAINGFGRIGRQAFRIAWGRKGTKIVAVNDLTEPRILAHLLKYDSVIRTWDREVSFDEHHLIIDGHKVPILAETEPAKLPWKKHKVDVVIESTGRFASKDAAGAHIVAGARKVVVSAPAKDAPTLLMGVNHASAKPTDDVVSNASCTTNSIAPVAAIMEEAFGVRKAMMTTVHSVTAEQNIVDGLPPARHPDLRRARAAIGNMVPTSTGAARAVTEALPSLKGKFDGLAIRVPTLDVSLSDFTFVLKKRVTPEQVNAAFKKAAGSARWKGVVGVSDVPLVSSDYIGSTYSTVVDLEMTRVVDGDLVKVLAWYDNEWGYANRLVEMAAHVGSL